jgi:hypothetical protein
MVDDSEQRDVSGVQDSSKLFDCLVNRVIAGLADKSVAAVNGMNSSDAPA